MINIGKKGRGKKLIDWMNKHRYLYVLCIMYIDISLLRKLYLIQKIGWIRKEKKCWNQITEKIKRKDKWLRRYDRENLKKLPCLRKEKMIRKDRICNR